MDHIKNLEEYIKKDFTYNYYKANKDGIYNDLEKDSINHCQDIEYALDEITALYELVKEMKERGKFDKS